MTLIVALCGCHKTTADNQCLSYLTTPITNVSGPNSGSVNQYIDFMVTFNVCGCERFERFEQTSEGDTTTISVDLKSLGCVCPALCRIEDSSFKFKALQAGIYYLKFLQAGNIYLTDTLIIQ